MQRIVFFAPHLLSPTIASGGDVLFCEIAARIAKARPAWRISAIAPDFARGALERYFETVVPLTTGDDGVQGGAVSTALKWGKRMAAATSLLADTSPDIVHSTGDFFVDVRPVLKAASKRFVRWSGVVHHVNESPLRRHNAFLTSGASYILQRYSFQLLKKADSISVLNRGVESELSAMSFDTSRIHIVGAGIDVNKFPPAPVSQRQRRVVWLNRLEPTKGLRDLPKVAAGLDADVHIDVVGRGPAEHVAALREALSREHVAEKVTLHGFLSDAEVKQIFTTAAAFISCSYEEGWGISIAEALAAGLPCVAYDLPSHREIFDDAITTVPIGDTAAFSRAVNDILNQGDTDTQRAHRRTIAEQFSLDRCAERQAAVFEALMA